VPCERAFSALHQLHTKTRNALTPERVDKLLYIQINSRTLKRDALIEKLPEDEVCSGPRDCGGEYDDAEDETVV